MCRDNCVCALKCATHSALLGQMHSTRLAAGASSTQVLSANSHNAGLQVIHAYLLGFLGSS